MSEIVVLKAHKTNKVLPPAYSLDHDPDMAVLRRADGSVVAPLFHVELPALGGARGSGDGPRPGRVRVVAVMTPRRDGGG
jgi:hypothetical protein